MKDDRAEGDQPHYAGHKTEKNNKYQDSVGISRCMVCDRGIRHCIWEFTDKLPVRKLLFLISTGSQ